MKKEINIAPDRLELFTELVEAFRLIDYGAEPVNSTVTMPSALHHAREMSRRLGDITPEIRAVAEAHKLETTR